MAKDEPAGVPATVHTEVVADTDAAVAVLAKDAGKILAALERLPATARVEAAIGHARELVKLTGGR